MGQRRRRGMRGDMVLGGGDRRQHRRSLTTGPGDAGGSGVMQAGEAGVVTVAGAVGDNRQAAGPKRLVHAIIGLARGAQNRRVRHEDEISGVDMRRVSRRHPGQNRNAQTRVGRRQDPRQCRIAGRRVGHARKRHRPFCGQGAKLV